MNLEDFEIIYQQGQAAIMAEFDRLHTLIDELRSNNSKISDALQLALSQRNEQTTEKFMIIKSLTTAQNEVRRLMVELEKSQISLLQQLQISETLEKVIADIKAGHE